MGIVNSNSVVKTTRTYALDHTRIFQIHYTDLPICCSKDLFASISIVHSLSYGTYHQIVHRVQRIHPVRRLQLCHRIRLSHIPVLDHHQHLSNLTPSSTRGTHLDHLIPPSGNRHGLPIHFDPLDTANRRIVRGNLLRRLTRLQVQEFGRLVRRAGQEFCAVLPIVWSALRVAGEREKDEIPWTTKVPIPVHHVARKPCPAPVPYSATPRISSPEGRISSWLHLRDDPLD